jgi:hypothetical protein
MEGTRFLADEGSLIRDDLAQSRKGREGNANVISTEGRNLSQIPRIILGMTGLACHFAILASWRDVYFRISNLGF